MENKILRNQRYPFGKCKFRFFFVFSAAALVTTTSYNIESPTRYTLYAKTPEINHENAK